MANRVHALKLVLVSFLAGFVLLNSEELVQAKEMDPKDKIVNLKEGETLNIKETELSREQDKVMEQIIKTDFANKVDQKLKEYGYKRYTHTGEVDVNYQLVELVVQKKPGESQVETIKNIDKIVSQLAKENNVVPTFAKVSFR
ncbi:hypothetical protein [Peribacillus frigoritolerans]|uniref:hypothetical protein n=1 Tax=Peribacillus frigoritolerans TaxID=450367 RepID=UPI002281A1BA|nr:hypothetical protein [Peribacillus frigoritolerans]MCY9141313.1 hypothetical protein [Peribacillus frigoritolerans]